MPATILVVEDDPLVARVTCRMLSDAGYHCEWVTQGQEAIARVEQGSLAADLLLLDIRLPDISGLEVARRIVERRPSVPVLFVSGYPESQGEHLPASLWSFLPKPFTSEQLEAAVRELLSQRPTPPPP